MKLVEEKYIPLIKSIIDEIRYELDRLYWNKYQTDMDSPFDNTGNEYTNDVFIVRAYDWGDNDYELPNFQYPGINIYWYKYSCRGLTAYTDDDLTLDYLTNMLNDCIAALRKDFGEYYEEK